VPLPANVSTGTVIGHFVDTDGSASQGTIYFTPNAPRLLDASASPPTTIVTVEAVAGHLNSSGNLIDKDGNTGVVLIATNDADLNPVNWTWNVLCDLGPARGKYSYAIAVPAGTTVDLTTVAPAFDTSGTPVTQGIVKRVNSVTSSATPAINTSTTDLFLITALAVNITSMTTNLTGSPVSGQSLIVAITGTATRTISWGASFEASTVALPTTTSGTNRLDVEFIWNAATSKWRCIRVS
jgi:hypothetical protein